MTPYADDKTSSFTIPREPRKLLEELAVAQRDYEDAKNASEKATQQEADASARRKTLKRDIINALREKGMSDSRSDKEYVDEAAWIENERNVAIAQDKKRSALVDESIARQRMLTLRASLVPITMYAGAVIMIGSLEATAMEYGDKALVNLNTLKSSVDSFYRTTDAVASNAEHDSAHSDDASVAHA